MIRHSPFGVVISSGLVYCELCRVLVFKKCKCVNCITTNIVLLPLVHANRNCKVLLLFYYYDYKKRAETFIRLSLYNFTLYERKTCQEKN